MKHTLPNCLILFLVATSTALVAYLFSLSGNRAPVQALFLAFVAAILAIQLIPLLMLLVGMLKGVCSRREKEVED